MDMPQRYKTNNDYRLFKNVKISKNLLVQGAENVHIDSMDVIEDDVILRGDLGKIQIGRGTIINAGTVIRPSLSSSKPPFEYKYFIIGDHCYVGKKCIINSRNIGNCVWIGDNCILGERTEIGSKVKILPDTYIPPETKIPDNSVFGGNPGKYLGELSEAFEQLLEEFCNDYFLNLIITQGNLN